MLTGQDRVGVLLCSRRFGELWLGFDTDVSAGLALGTNATQLQVAAGVLAGWIQLGSRMGIHFVEKLDWQAVLKVVGEVLGPTVMVHDPMAVPLTLADRVEMEISNP
jgi:homospermidine synthase